ncbi:MULTISPECIES: thiamine phosphate synthase [Staphylococcus]|uniref:Thiamine-phosphate synthase n=1 Tax=Staphylococcus lugdunensis TaxID=28035 RepID=A0ABX6BTY1_STALU|nr:MULTISPECIES: thiamine phosphate synthase [Staphylococcus]ADC87069.1 Thiamin-phosphate pyrophosphorylase [Staphylococcus lugdunensis HKU09-01]ARJ08851.1 thiamine phosphate synthase [Staphylococcus lugdunensis]ARJ29265.1 thiamine phosphate synthase [Staphylococcus lugdunensis]EKS23175.1 thiamine-phosphate pyrophosphorylase [Staphylococcus lugdunensis ACS-027-V-Sch2]MCH8640891.1 thiamine phosphate synthase [Staphylococcus lugdunensis]
MFKSTDLKVYFICGTQDIPEGKSLEQVVTQALESGVTMFQFREKGSKVSQDKKIEQLALKLKELCHNYQVPFIVNDNVALALKVQADGIHVGQDDAKVEDFFEQFHDKIIGLSVSNLDELKRSDLTHVDYIGVGPIYQTPSKSDASTPVGPEMILTLRKEIGDFPIVAIGGVTENNAQAVVDAGADGISVISAIARSQNIDSTVNKFLSYYN